MVTDKMSMLQVLRAAEQRRGEGAAAAVQKREVARGGRGALPEDVHRAEGRLLQPLSGTPMAPRFPFGSPSYRAAQAGQSYWMCAPGKQPSI